jgi:pyruvate,orthophosphate dikinase
LTKEGLLTEREALLRIDPVRTLPFFSLQQLIEKKSGVVTMIPETLCRGIPACQGAVTGALTFISSECISKSYDGQRMIYCSIDCAIVDYQAIKAAAGVITLTGSLASDAAIFCRSLSKPCVTAVSGIRIEIIDKGNWIPISSVDISKISETQEVVCRLVSEKTGTIVNAGEEVTLDGTNGTLYPTVIPTDHVLEDESFQQILQWSDKYRKTKVFSNFRNSYLSQGQEVMKLLEDNMQNFVGDGIGMIDTDEMFRSDDERLHLLRCILLSTRIQEKQNFMNKLTEIFRQEFVQIFHSSRCCSSSQVITIQLLNESISSFLPESESEVLAFASYAFKTVNETKQMVQKFSETNPSLGCRGSKFISPLFRPILEVQVSAIMLATADVISGSPDCFVHPEIAIPMITNDRELKAVMDIVNTTAFKVVV